MKKSLLVVALTSVAVVACSKSENKTEQTPTAEHTIVASSATHSETQHDMHTAEHSLDWAGKYTGKLPCADCEGIQTALELKNDKTYELKETYIGGKSDGKPFETQGTFTFDQKNPSMIVLDQKSENRKFFVAENTLTALDMEGNKIEGAMADLYILKK